MRSKEVEEAIKRINKVREKQFNQFEQRGKTNITIGVNDLRAIDTVLKYISELEEKVNSIDSQFIHKDKVYEIVEEINKQVRGVIMRNKGIDEVERNKCIEIFKKKVKRYDESVEIKGVSVGEEMRILDTVVDYISELEEENRNAKYQYDLGYKACEIDFTNKIRDKIKELEELNFNNYANEYDNGNEVKYYILKKFKEIIGE